MRSSLKWEIAFEIRTKGFEHNFQAVYEERDPISDVFVWHFRIEQSEKLNVP